ncbi:MAG: hypothetical protein AAFY72_18900 [Cyanobacteria bacterium J06649_4]
MDYIQVLEAQDAEEAIELLKSVVTLSSKEDGSPDVALLKQSDYVVAPVMHKGTLTPAILERFYAAAKTTGHSEMTAVGLYSAEEQHCYRVPMSLEALSELRGTSCGVVNFVLFAGAPDWLIVFDDQLYIAYGPASFVTALVDDIEGAYKAVESRLNELYNESQADIPSYAVQEINRMGEYLDSALEKLSKQYPNATEGAMVSVV